MAIELDENELRVLQLLQAEQQAAEARISRASDLGHRYIDGLILLSTAILGLVLPQFLQVREALCVTPVSGAAWWLVATIVLAVASRAAVDCTMPFFNLAFNKYYEALASTASAEDVGRHTADLRTRVNKTRLVGAVIVGTLSIGCHISFGLAMWDTSTSVVCLASAGVK